MRRLACLLTAALGCVSARAGDDQDRYEEQAAARIAQHSAGRSVRAHQGERGNTLRDLEAAFPGKITRTEPGKKESEGEEWFAPLSSDGEVWRKTDAVAAGLGPMFERWRQRLELGPVPSIKRDEFMKFSKLIVHNAGAMQNEGGDINTDKEADKVFRVLDLNDDGVLTGSEYSTGMTLDKGLGGRVTKEQYREYFSRRVEKKTEALADLLKANESLMRKLNLDGGVERGTGLPAWFNALDVNKDMQVALSEWRKSGKDIMEFLDMDLNGDGLLTTDEYLRWTQQKREEQQRREDK